MANLRRRNFRVALVACAPPLARIHERVFQALGIRESGQPGKPGGGCVLLSERGDLETFGLKYLAEEWLSKLDDGKKSPQKQAATWERFALAESSCFKVNQYLKREWASSPWSQEIRLATKLVSKVLGRFDWDEAAKGFGWGPGATTRLTRRKSDAAHKYSGTPHATIGNAILANACIKHSPLWEREFGFQPGHAFPVVEDTEGVGYVKIVDGNRITTVAKNYKTDRTIAIEPDMNMYVQRGIGSVMRNRLKRVGVDLDDQSRNQRLALVGSVANSLATIDLSMASDTVSRAVVELLVPPDWLEALGQCRSPFGVLPSGEKIFYQKFSSMGNGYTFELESVIFFCLALAVCRLSNEELTRVSVYGDDIVLPVGAAGRFEGLLSYLGFTPNLKKSFSDGPFRESCGKHYYAGFEVTPFYVKRAPKTLVDLFKIHNQLFRYLNRTRWLDNEQRSALRKVCAWLRSYAPASWRRPSIVDNMGDGAFVGYFDEVTPSTCRHGWDGYRFRSMVALPTQEFIDPPGLLLKSLVRMENIRFARTLDGSNPTLLCSEPETVEVFPVKEQRYVEDEIFVTRSLVHRQSALC
jgi:hypothetical protein